MQITQEELAGLQAEHVGRKVVAFEFPDREMDFVVVLPNRAEWKRFMHEAQNEKTEAISVENLTRRHCIWPSKEELARLADDGFPTVFEKIGKAITDACGGSAKADRKK